MLKFRRLIKHNIDFVKNEYSTAIKPTCTLDENVQNNIESEKFKPRNHPGIFKPRTVALPQKFVDAVLNILEDHPIKALKNECGELVRHLRYKVPPMEHQELRDNANKIEERLQNKFKGISLAGDTNYDDFIKNKVRGIMKEKIYNWKPVKYDVHNALLYLIGRSAPEYAVLVKIFSEINARDPNFRPKTFLDFGSGIGMATWAANIYWQKFFIEFFNVDASSEMNDLNQLLLMGGRPTKNLPIRGLFYRQFLPAKNNPYDLVICAYSLLELPSGHSRLETLLNLWNKTQKYLVIVEQGTNAGFKVLNEARDFILNVKQVKGFVFSPCPHDEVCPRFMLNDNTPCNFEVKYSTMPLAGHSESKTERYSYVVFKKGNRSDSDTLWPRVVRETIVRSKHSICRLCTSKGKLQEVIFTASKQGKTAYHCARSTQWGDLLPVKIEEQGVDESSGFKNNGNDGS